MFSYSLLRPSCFFLDFFANFVLSTKKAKDMNRLLTLAILVITSLTFNSCGDDTIWDIAAVGIDIHIVDAQGADLLSESTEGNWVGYEFKGLYADEEYTADWSILEKIPGSRYYMPHFDGLIASQDYKWDGYSWSSVPGCYKLCFGEFDGAKNQKITLIFSVPELGRDYTIELTHRISWKRNKPKMNTHISIDGGKETEGESVEIVLPRRQPEA